MTKKHCVAWIIAILLFFVSIICSLSIGRYALTLPALWHILLSGPTNSVESSIIWNLRIPRLIADILVGSSLSIAGIYFQGIFRNPLVSPAILGVSSGAAFGAVLGIMLWGISAYSSIFAFVFGIFSVGITYLIASCKGKVSTLSLVLSGMIVSSIFTALISLIKYVADPYDKLPAIVYWLMGSFASIPKNTLAVLAIPIIVTLIILYLMRWRLNVLSLEDDEALSLGINVTRMKVIFILLSTIITAASVTLTGVIGWVGLVVPHICRMIMGVNHQYLVPYAIVMGAIFMVFVDLISRSVLSAELPIGILTALIGAPFFAVLFIKAKETWS